ncbi:hypothetical protein ROSI111154_06545 [Rouxiella silvae]
MTGNLLEYYCRKGVSNRLNVLIRYYYNQLNHLVHNITGTLDEKIQCYNSRFNDRTHWL